MDGPRPNGYTALVGSRGSRPGLARADRIDRRRFVAIALGLGVDEEATDAFVYAYRAQSPVDRRRLADAVARDLDRAGHDPGRALAALFLAEEDPTVLAHLWERLHRSPDVPSSVAAVVGDDAHGGVFLGLRTEARGAASGLFALFVVWRGDRLELAVGEPESETEAIDRLGDLAGTRALRSAPVSWAIDEAAERLWRHLRAGGALPAGAERFAPLFSPGPTS